MKSINSSALEALQMMERALAVLDENEAPGDIGAHLDLAIERLRAHLSMPRNLEDFGEPSFH